MWGMMKEGRLFLGGAESVAVDMGYSYVGRLECGTHSKVDHIFLRYFETD